MSGIFILETALSMGQSVYQKHKSNLSVIAVIKSNLLWWIVLSGHCYLTY